MGHKVQSVLAFVRVLVNDPDAAVFDDDTLLPTVNAVFRQLQSALATAGNRLPIQETTIEVPAGTTELETGPGAGDLPEELIQPDILYERQAPDVIAAAPVGAARAANVVTITTSTPHQLQVGDSVIVAGVAVTTFNGTVTVVATPTPTTFTYAQVGADTTSGGGTVQYNDRYTEVRRIRFIFPHQAAQRKLLLWKWQNGKIKLIGSTTDRSLGVNYQSQLPDLKLTATADGNELPLDGIQDALAYRTAAIIVRSRGQSALAEEFENEWNKEVAKIINRDEVAEEPQEARVED